MYLLSLSMALRSHLQEAARISGAAAKLTSSACMARSAAAAASASAAAVLSRTVLRPPLLSRPSPPSALCA